MFGGQAGLSDLLRSDVSCDIDIDYKPNPDGKGGDLSV